MHLLLDDQGYFRHFAVITEGKKHEIQVARRVRFEPDTILVFDRGYTDCRWFADLTAKGAWFDTRMQNNADYGVVEERELPARSRRSQAGSDRLFLQFDTSNPREYYLRRIEYWDEKQERWLVFLTNNLKLAAPTLGGSIQGSLAY